MKNWITLLFILNVPYLYSQKEGYNWYFGSFSALTFNSGKPVAITTSPMLAYYGSSTISSPEGKLQFYSNGRNVYNRKDSIMVKDMGPNNTQSAQNSLIVPWPDSSHLYYIFSPPAFSFDSTKYTLINMKLNHGLGDTVAGKKNIRLPVASSGKVNAVRHANHHDYWVVMPSGNSDSIHAYLITSKGIILPPVKSKTGIKINYIGGWGSKGFGYFKLSPDGKKLCDVNYNDSSIIADFDSETGKVSNVWGFNYRSNSMSVEFSPKSNYLYMPYNGEKLIQYDINTKSKATFLASAKMIDSLGYHLYGTTCLQVAPDGKIYFSEYGSKYLHVIHAPDSAGRNARIQKNAVYLYSWYNSSIGTSTGLPDFIQSFFHKPNFLVRQNCANDSVFFTIKDYYKLDSVHWDFGDPSSGIFNASTKTQNVFHYYKELGNYKARLISFHKGFIDTIYETFLLKPLKPRIGNDTTFCKAKYIGLSADGEYATYKWSRGQTTKSVITATPGIFTLTVSDYSGCKGSDTIVISKPVVKAYFEVNNLEQCLADNDFKFKEKTSYTDGLRKKSYWMVNDDLVSNDSIIDIKFDTAGSYPIKLISESYGGCSDTITRTINVNPDANANFVINESIQCFNKHSFDFKNTGVNTGSINYSWDLGDDSISKAQDVSGKKYLNQISYSVKLSAKTDKNCFDSLVRIITILSNPKAGFDWEPGCEKDITKFQYTGTKPIQKFLWDFNREGASAIENPSQIFNTRGTKIVKLIVISNNGCTDTFMQNLSIPAQPRADFTAEDVCETDSVLFINKSEDATNFTWKFGDGLISKSNLANGETRHKYQTASSTTFNVTLVAVASGDCSDSIVKAVTVNENPKSDFTSIPEGGGRMDFKATQTNGTNYFWLLGNGDSATLINSNYSYTYRKSGLYTVCLKVTNTAGCESQTCKQFSITGDISLLHKQSGFKIYPNPNSGKFTIEINSLSNDVFIEVFDLLGNLIKSVETISNKTSYPVELEVANGMYLVKVKNENMVFNQRVSITK